MTTTICSGTAFSGTPVDVTNGTVPVGTTYTWTVAANTNVTGQSAQASAQSSISQTLTNSTNTVQTVVYTVTPTFGTCVGATFTVTVTVNPSPILSNASISACTGVALTLATPTVSGASYSWTGPNSFSSSTQNPTVTTNATSVHAGIYSVTTTVSGCTSPAGTTNVVVNQNPSINALSPP
jgi:hypothetical protein